MDKQWFGHGTGRQALGNAVMAGLRAGARAHDAFCHSECCLGGRRYEMLKRLGYFVTESSEHFPEYTPFFIKEGRDDLIERFGIPPTFIGELPPQLTALIRTNIDVQELTVRALTTESREHVYNVAMMDPNTAADQDLQQISDLVDALLKADGRWLPERVRVG